MAKLHVLGPAENYLERRSMTLVDLDGTPCIVSRDRDGDYHAMGAFCTHRGAPLDEGLLVEDMVICPWHHACFDVRTGARTQPPALNDVPHYPTLIDSNGNLVINSQPQKSARPFANHADPNTTMIIIGGGAAGHTAAEEFRRSGFRGRVVMLSAEPNRPVDRTSLSKSYLRSGGDTNTIALRDSDWYADRDIELVLNATVTRVDTSAQAVRFVDGNRNESVLYYDKVLLATGSTPNTFPNTQHLRNVHTLRTPQDAATISQQTSEGTRVVIVGASFIGMEAAGTLAKRGADVLVVAEQPPFASMFGQRVGAMIQRHFENKLGVTFALGARVRGVQSEGERATGVELDNWDVHAADGVLLAIGVTPNTAFLRSSNLNTTKDGGLIVRKDLQTNAPNVYAAGDIAAYPDALNNPERIEHWRTAMQHGVIAARNMMGGAESVRGVVPFFWTEPGGLQLTYVGYAKSWERIIYRGRVEKGNFIAFFVSNELFRAAVGMGRDRDMNALTLIVKQGLHITPQQMGDPDFDLEDYAVRGVPARSGL
jgi:apoptosis-inducing factor 3